MNCKYKLGIYVLASIVAMSCAHQSWAQYRYRYPAPVAPTVVAPGYGGVVAPYAGRGGVLAGSADVINAQGEFQQQTEEARITREKAYQESLQSTKDAFKLNKYIEANTPTFGETQEKEKGMRTRRILNKPTNTEIISGEALNTLLPFVEQMTDQGMHGPPIPLSPSILSKINVTGPTTKGDVSMLGHGGEVEWPLALRGYPGQKQLAAEISKCVEGTINGTLTNKEYQKARSDIEKLRDNVKDQYAKEKLDMVSFLAADNFMQKLDFAFYELSKPGAKNELSGAFRATGRNVAELVANMSHQGLRFAPATPGYENAYFSLQNSMASYAIGAQNSFGFQLQSVAPRKNFKVQ